MRHVGTDCLKDAERNGAVLGMVLIVMLVLSVLGVSLLSLAAANGLEAGHAVCDAQAFWAAEAGLAHAKSIAQKNSLTLQELGLVGCQVISGMMATAQYTVDVQKQATGEEYVVTATGTAMGMEPCVLSVHLRYAGHEGTFGASSVKLSGGGCALGTVRSNGGIEITGGANVQGDAIPGLGYTVNDPSRVTGSTTPAAQALTLDPIDPQALADAQALNNNAAIPPAYLSSGELTVADGTTCTLPAGTYYLTKVTVSGGSTLAVSGQVLIYCTGDFTVSGGSLLNLSGNPDNLRILSTGNSVVLSGASDIQAHVYAPNASDCTVSGGGNLHGSFFAGGATEYSGGSCFYEAGVGWNGKVRTQVAEWRQVR